MIKRPLMIIAASFASLFFAVLPVHAQNTAQVPFVVVTDNLGIPLGPIVSVDGALSIPVVRIDDPDENIPVFLEIRNNTNLVGAVSTTLFDQDGCQGTVYHNATQSVSTLGMASLSGFVHSVARPSGGNQVLYRSDTGETDISQTIESQYNINNGCQDVNFTVDVRTATFVMDLDDAFPPPYSLQ